MAGGMTGDWARGLNATGGLGLLGAVGRLGVEGAAERLGGWLGSWAERQSDWAGGWEARRLGGEPWWSHRDTRPQAPAHPQPGMAKLCGRPPYLLPLVLPTRANEH